VEKLAKALGDVSSDEIELAGAVGERSEVVFCESCADVVVGNSIDD
jgi:hypothetical protein